MKEKNREILAQTLYKKKELLDQKKEEKARLELYNPKRAAQIQEHIALLEQELKTLTAHLREADLNFQSDPPTIISEKERLYALLAPLDDYMRRGAAALKKKRILLFFARHPKVVLAQMLHQGAEEAATLPKKIAPFKKGAYIDICQKIEQFCYVLVDHSNKRWNHALYSGEFLTLYEQWNSLVKNLRPDA